MAEFCNISVGSSSTRNLMNKVRLRIDVQNAARMPLLPSEKSITIGSTALVSLALFGALCAHADNQGAEFLLLWVFHRM